ncbi:ATP-dependent RNA helicase dbp6 [Madurella mycetomatis]|uniref:ATP-dependent RNA helicase n=1 Tax=Madurella mycetomatis TaxID=100816 RepID=A0A175VQD3_9PEZI|nr:ATP-dependent RNA helicase dbp6 [Madurella mycetomatis]
MYNRYIPPVKPASLTSNSTPYSRYGPAQGQESRQETPPQPRRIVFEDTNFSLASNSNNKQTRDEAHAETAEIKKPKTSKSKKAEDEPNEERGALTEAKEPKPKKRKRDERQQIASEEGSAVDLPDEQRCPRPEPEPLTVDSSNAVDAKPKPKREKRKKKRDHHDLEANPDGDVDDIRRRHKSVFEKVEKALQAKASNIDGQDKTEAAEETVEPEVEHGLEPIPQPDPVIFDESKLTYETLPPWLASPIHVTSGTRQAFTELGIAPESAKILASRGFEDAFAVQTAVLPLLLPSADRQGDVVVAAPTGSGKTLSYVLPMVHDISKSRITRLRALIVLPTRDLVQQVQLACEACVAAFAVGGGKKVKIGTAMGNRVFKEEQATIMAEEQRYDPDGYNQHMQKQNQLVDPEDSDDGEDALGLEPTKPLPYHVFTHISKVDVLICTPGRLVEHISKTPGFTLDYVRWLVVDEADKLLAQDFQQWLDIVTGKLSVTKPSARDFPGSNKSGVRKVILSATMTRDLSLLNSLKLSRPKLVVVEGTKAGEQSLPALLKEHAIKVREPSHKPLYLVDLLNSKHLVSVNREAPEDDIPMASETSESESSSSDSSSDSSSSSDADSDSDSISSTPETKPPPTKATKNPTLSTTVLIFTKSNEAALRLSRLLALLSPSFAPLIGTLTSSTKTSRRTRTLRAFAQGKLRILVASDLVSRGIDLLNLEHVVNYDLPISETSYVHRVGRTARAGRKGCAWTLVEHSEARRFWRDFAGEGKGRSRASLGRAR